MQKQRELLMKLVDLNKKQTKLLKIISWQNTEHNALYMTLYTPYIFLPISQNKFL